MTKEEAYDKETNEDVNSWASFSSGWDAAIQSLTPHALPDPCPYQAIIDIANEVLGKSFRVTEAHRKHIRARWNEGYREEDFRKVCEIKKDHWDHDPKWRAFLRPETLFGTKFDSYLNSEPTEKRKMTEDWQ